MLTKICPGLVVFRFFFSSRRRHTRSKRDWSSDVCSSDLAERLDLLFRTVPLTPDSAKLHTSTSVVEALAEQGISVTPNHIRALRTGRRNNPSFRLLAGLADIFRVPLDYFVNDTVAGELHDSLEALAVIRDTGVQQIMLRAHGVSSESLDSVLALLDQIRRIEGLDDADAQNSQGS